MTDAPSPLEQVAAAGAPTPVSPPLGATGLAGLSPDITAQFMQQMQEDRAQGKEALAQRKSALEQYQDAIKAAPGARTSADAFNAIGEGFYANPNYAWNPSAALASGFARMNQVSDLRRQQAQDAPVIAAQAGYENAKDLSDKIGVKDLLTPAATMSYLNQTMRTQGAGLRQMNGIQSKIFEDSLKKARENGRGDEAVASALAETNAALRGLKQPEITLDMLAASIGQPTTGAPRGAAVPPPPTSPLAALPGAFQRDIARDMARNPGVNARINIDPSQSPQVPGAAGAPPVSGVVLPPPPGWQPGQTTASTVPAPGAMPPSVGLTPAQRAANEAQVAGAKTAAEGQAEIVKEGTKYYTELSNEAHAANDTKRVLNKVDNNLQRLAANHQNGKFSDVNKFVSTVKVALDPDGSKGWATKEDVANAAAFEAADKENFQLGISSAKSLSSRATQMEFMRALTNNPNAMMTAKGREKIMELLKQTADDVTTQHADLQAYMKAHGVDPENPLAATPGAVASLTGHRNAYAQYQAQRIAGRDIADKYSDAGLTVPFKGADGKETQILVKPYWSNKYKALVAKYPDGIRKLNVANPEE